MKVTTDAVQVLGGAGYTRDFPVERYMREAKVMQIFEGTNQIQRLIIGRGLKESDRGSLRVRGAGSRVLPPRRPGRRRDSVTGERSCRWSAALQGRGSDGGRNPVTAPVPTR